MKTSVVLVDLVDLCEEGERFCASGQFSRASSCFMAAFSTNVSSTMNHVRTLDKNTVDALVSTLEAWLDEDSPPVEGLNKGLVAVFLSTVCPNNLSATIFKMEALLRGGHSCEEIFCRCSALLEGKKNPGPDGSSRLLLDGKKNPGPDGSSRLLLEVTRALARLFSQPDQGLQLYLEVYLQYKSEMVQLVRRRQSLHLDRILRASLDRLSPASSVMTSDTDQDLSPDMIRFLMEMFPGHPEVLEVQASRLFASDRFAESADVCLKLLAVGSDPSQEVLERRARVLTALAASYFSTGGHVSEACRSLGEAFETHPASARLHFQKVFTDSGRMSGLLRQQAERGISSFREKVLLRSDLRSTEGVELLDPVITLLRTMCHLEADGGGRELRGRLAECLVLRGQPREALSICSQLVSAAGQRSDQNPVQVLRGYARLLSEDPLGAMEDFQAVMEHETPHPSSCVRALCGRGLLRMMDGFHFLTALDYLTASSLHLQEVSLTVRGLVPWNLRGLLLTVLLEQSRVMLAGERGTCGEDPSEKTSPASKREKTAAGVHALALLLMDLQPGSDGPQILAADALQAQARVEESYRMLLSISPSSPRAPVLARLLVLQLQRGFTYDSDQLLKKLVQVGDTSCLRPLLAVVREDERRLLQRRCHAAASRLLVGRDEGAVREAVAYLSVAIIASGGAADALLERARCYVLLGQRKVAVFDFSAIIKDEPRHVPALCGRGFTHLMLHQQKECTRDILAALKIDPDTVAADILSLKDGARKLLCDWLHLHCRRTLSDSLSPGRDSRLQDLKDVLKVSGALMAADLRWSLLHVDALLAAGEVQRAAAHLSQVFGQEPRDLGALGRVGVLEARQKNFCSAAGRLGRVAEKDPECLDLLLKLVPLNQQEHLAQAAGQEADRATSEGHWARALTLLTVAVEAVRRVSALRLQYLRRRSLVLAQLSLHQRAVADLDLLIQNLPEAADQQVLVEDLCRRGRSLVLSSREGPGLEDFSRALDLSRDRTLRCVDQGLGRTSLAQSFARAALQQYAAQQPSRAWTLVESGLAVDPTHVELRRLRSKVKREVAGPCLVH